jgi:hypothetical protein
MKDKGPTITRALAQQIINYGIRKNLGTLCMWYEKKDSFPNKGQ